MKLHKFTEARTHTTIALPESSLLYLQTGEKANTTELVGADGLGFVVVGTLDVIVAQLEAKEI